MNEKNFVDVDSKPDGDCSFSELCKKKHWSGTTHLLVALIVMVIFLISGFVSYVHNSHSSSNHLGNTDNTIAVLQKQDSLLSQKIEVPDAIKNFGKSRQHIPTGAKISKRD